MSVCVGGGGGERERGKNFFIVTFCCFDYLLM